MSPEPSRQDSRLLCLSLRGLPQQEAAIWIDILGNGWRNHPKALPMQIVGLLLMGLLITKSNLPMAQWLLPWACMILVCAAVTLLAVRFRQIQLHAGNYGRWRALLLGWRAVHGVSGGVLCALLYGGLTPEWQLPLLITVVVFTYGLTFYAIEDFGLAMVGTAPVVLSLLVALMWHGSSADHYIAVLLVAACINGWLAGRAISIRLFEAARTRQRNAVLVEELAREVDEVTRAKAQADQANREKSEFFAAASHDLRQPLYSLQLLSDHLRKQLTSLYQMEVADKLGGALTSMRHLFERMFDVARIEAQKVACQPQNVSVRDLFTSLDQEFALACSEKGLRWSVHPTDDWLWTDAVLAQRMLRNLLENAVRYTQHGEVRLRARRRGGLVHCQVWDTGMGISRADRPKVFNDYFQVQNTARRAQDGLGLGLGVVRRLVALTGTRVALHSRLGRGSCFDIAFEPGQAQPPQVPVSQVDAATTLGDHDCVLVIEDQATVLDAVVTVLQHSGYRTLGGENAMALVQQAAEQELGPCVVICDYRLSHSYSGFDAIAELRHELGDEFPAILVTGDLDPQIQARAAEQGIRLMHKPLDREQLLQALHQSTTRSG
ncbi:hybrid sensor histidine kinase/response regulator [Aquabacterium sp.]|uniref:ATP-binding response regulator n=1 Tax=Aquabacterium sp. TaxID=1872578 RepID=UPI0024891C21|nr:hybrid sensor histidine kinase/response regulator [Aquabacterium sp.]MDI1260468.1 hybrid sensor histidine kinase/response regulator [Aquabacterium sp.]